MLRHPLTALALVALLVVSALATCLFTLRWFFTVQELQRVQARSEGLTRTSALMQQLAAEALEYSRHHSELNPVLNQFNLRIGAGAATNGFSTPATGGNQSPSNPPRTGISPAP